jgi:hypothetical protein
MFAEKRRQPTHDVDSVETGASSGGGKRFKAFSGQGQILGGVKDEGSSKEVISDDAPSFEGWAESRVVKSGSDPGIVLQANQSSSVRLEPNDYEHSDDAEMFGAYASAFEDGNCEALIDWRSESGNRRPGRHRSGVIEVDGPLSPAGVWENGHMRLGTVPVKSDNFESVQTSPTSLPSSVLGQIGQI